MAIRITLLTFSCGVAAAIYIIGFPVSLDRLSLFVVMSVGWVLILGAWLWQAWAWVIWLESFFVERVAQAIDEIWGGSPSDFRVEVCTFHLTKNTIMPFELCLNRATLQVHVDGQVDREETPVTYSSMFIPLAPPQELFAWCDADRFAFSTTVPTVNRKSI